MYTQQKSVRKDPVFVLTVAILVLILVARISQSVATRAVIFGIFVTIGVIMDLLSSYIMIQGVFRPHRPAGSPMGVAPIGMYLAALTAIWPSLSVMNRIALGIGFILFHLTCYFLLPFLVTVFSKKR